MAANPLHDAYEHFQAGRVAEAERRCRAVLAGDPGHAEANHLLGIMRFQEGRTAEACDLLERAAASPAAAPEMHNNLGAVLNKLGETDKAIAAFERALAINPAYADALNNLGVIYRDSKQTEQAIAAFRRAVALIQSFTTTHSGVGSNVEIAAAASSVFSPRSRWYTTPFGPTRNDITPELPYVAGSAITAKPPVMRPPTM